MPAPQTAPRRGRRRAHRAHERADGVAASTLRTARREATSRRPASSPQVRAHVPEVRKEGQVDEVLEIIVAGRPARSPLLPDDALHDLHVPEAPERELL